MLVFRCRSEAAISVQLNWAAEKRFVLLASKDGTCGHAAGPELGANEVAIEVFPGVTRLMMR